MGAGTVELNQLPSLEDVYAEHRQLISIFADKSIPLEDQQAAANKFLENAMACGRRTVEHYRRMELQDLVTRTENLLKIVFEQPKLGRRIDRQASWEMIPEELAAMQQDNARRVIRILERSQYPPEVISDIRSILSDYLPKE